MTLPLQTTDANSSTARYGLPLLFAGQAQKEMFHNAALAALDALITPVVQGQTNDPAALDPEAGHAWLIGNAPQGAWEGHERQIASWTQNGWIFVEPKSGMLVMDLQTGCFRIFREDDWFVPNALPSVTGGTTVDVEARAMINSIVEIIRNFRFSPLDSE